MIQDKLLTNVNRVRKHISSESKCPIYCSSNKDPLYILRDCRIAKGILLSLGALEVGGNFCNHNLSDWFKFNA